MIPEDLQGGRIEFPKDDPEKLIHGCWALLEALSGMYIDSLFCLFNT